MRAAVGFSVGLVAVAASLQSAIAQPQSILTYHGDAGRSGHFVVPALTWDKARSARLERNFDARVAGHLYAQPLYWRIPNSSSALVLVATEDDIVQAFDAATGNEVWRRSVGQPISSSSLPCGNINPLGITGTPVIDPATEAIYFDAAVEQATGPRHQVFALSLKDGRPLPGWPIDVADALSRTGRQFDPRIQNQRAALTLLGGSIYVSFGGHFGDCGDYHGWVVGLPLDRSDKVFSFETRARGGGIWAPGGLSVIGHDIFFATGNTFGAKTWGDGEAVLRVTQNLQLGDDKRDYFAPSDWKVLDARDEDLGGTNPLPIYHHDGSQPLLVALGKDGKAYLLAGSDLGGIGGQLAANTVSRSRIITSPVVYPVGGDEFVAFEAPGSHCPNASTPQGLTVLKISDGSPPRMSTAWCGDLSGRGAAIVTTTDGHANPIVWILGAEGDNRLHAFRGDTGEPIFTSDRLTGLRHFETLIATEDHLYVGSDERIYAFDF